MNKTTRDKHNWISCYLTKKCIQNQEKFQEIVYVEGEEENF